MQSRFIRLLLDPQGGEGNGATTTTEANGKAVAATSSTPDPEKLAESLIAKFGTATEALVKLAGEGHAYREKIRGLEARVPPEGSRVLTGDQAALWDSYTTLGGVDDLKAIISERDEYKTKATGYERRDGIRTIAGLYGFDPDVLADRIGDGDLPEVKEVAEGGKAVKRAFFKDASGKDVELSKHAEAAWAKYLPVLKQDKGGTIPGTPGRRSPTPAPIPSPTTPAAPARRMTL